MIRDYLCDHKSPNYLMYKHLIALALRSCAKICIIPLQDWLGLDNSARMNTPGTVDVNWRWRLQPGQIPEELDDEILIFTKCFGRANWDALNALEEGEEAAQVAALVDSSLNKG